MHSVQKIVIIGQAPSSTSDPNEPLSGRSGKRLADVAGIEFSKLGETFERWNVLDVWPGHAGKKGDAFPLAEARAAARERIIPRLRGRVALALGARVAVALDHAGAAPFVWRTDARGFSLALVPHTSGVNLWWNAPENVAAARRFFDDILGRKRP